MRWLGQVRAAGHVAELGAVDAPSWEAARAAFAEPASAVLHELAFPDTPIADRPTLERPEGWPAFDPRVLVARAEEDAVGEETNGAHTNGAGDIAELADRMREGLAPAFERMARAVDGAMDGLRRLGEWFSRAGARAFLEGIPPEVRRAWWAQRANRSKRVFIVCRIASRRVRRFRMRYGVSGVLEYYNCRDREWLSTPSQASDFPWGVAREIAAGTRNAWIEEASPF